MALILDNRSFFLLKYFYRSIKPFKSEEFEKEFLDRNRRLSAETAPILMYLLLGGWISLWLSNLIIDYPWITRDEKVKGTIVVAISSILILWILKKFKSFIAQRYELFVTSLTISISTLWFYIEYQLRSPSSPAFLCLSLTALVYILIVSTLALLRPTWRLAISITAWIMLGSIYCLYRAYPSDVYTLYRLTCYESFALAIGGLLNWIRQQNDREIFLRNKRLMQHKEIIRVEREAKELRTKFLATLTHEIRTPMSGIKGLVQLMQQRGYFKNEKDVELSQALTQSCDRLLNTMNDLLDYAQTNLGGFLNIKPRAFDLESSVLNLAKIFEHSTNSKGLRLLVNHVHADQVGMIWADEEKFSRVLTNLISNAIKFTENGQITISSSLHKLSDENVLLRVIVEDTGIGINKIQLQYIFEPFYQIDSKSTRRYQGNGLGLAICKQIVEAMNGEISVESTYGSGSKFIVEIPAQKFKPDVFGKHDVPV